jgi:hypothetical protein
VDYLFYALYRTDRLALGVPLEVRDEPVAECCGHFPQYVGMRDVTSPDALSRLADEYYDEELSRFDLSWDALHRRIRRLTRRFEAYLPFWTQHVLPLESNLMDGWRDQLCGGEVLELMQRITRLRWPFPQIHLFACYHHPSGSALTPHPYLFSTLFDRHGVEPNVAWFLGHEGTHLLLDAARWWEHPEATAGIRWLGSRYLAEEALCLLLQNRMATVCGLLPESEMQVLGESRKHLAVYRRLQARWDDYMSDPDTFPSIIEFFLASVTEARESRRRKRRSHEPYAASARAA